MFQFSFPMSGKWRVRLTFALAMSALLASVSYAQHDHAAPASPIPRPEPLKFDSVLSRYKTMTDQKVGSWREANDTVTRIGGWRSYLKEAQSPDAKTAAPPASPSLPVAPVKPSAPPAANPHAGHGAKP